jgi:hypothetical protein
MLCAALSIVAIRLSICAKIALKLLFQAVKTPSKPVFARASEIGFRFPTGKTNPDRVRWTSILVISAPCQDQGWISICKKYVKIRIKVFDIAKVFH